jgi:hypothetical protein
MPSPTDAAYSEPLVRLPDRRQKEASQGFDPQEAAVIHGDDRLEDHMKLPILVKHPVGHFDGGIRLAIGLPPCSTH